MRKNQRFILLPAMSFTTLLVFGGRERRGRRRMRRRKKARIRKPEKVLIKKKEESENETKDERKLNRKIDNMKKENCGKKD